MRRRAALCVAALVACHVLLALLTFEPRPHTGGDNAAYITLARSLIERGAYIELWDPAEPPHTKYPPVFPAILAIAMLAGLQPWVQLKLVVLGFSATAIAFSFLWLRARRQHVAALVVPLIIAVAPGVLREGRWILSDVPFWAFSMIALWAFQRLRPGDRLTFATGAAATVLAYFTRSAGLPLLLAALAWLVWRRCWRRFAGLAAFAAVPALLWGLRSRALAPGGYISEFWLVDPYRPLLGSIGPLDLVGRVLENAWKYAFIHLPTLLSGATGGIMAIVSVAILGLAAAGWLLRVRSAREAPDRVRVAELFLPLYVGLILVWPAVWSGERFLLPVLPLLLGFAADAFGRLARRVAGRRDLVLVAAATLLLLATAVPGLVRGMQVAHECTRAYWRGERYPCLGAGAWDDFFSVATRASEVLPADAVVLNRKPRLFHVLSGGLKARNYPLSPDPAEFFAAAEAAGARYVVFDQLDAVADLYLRPALLRHAERFCFVLVEPATATVLFGIRADRGGDAPPPEAGEGEISFAFCPADYWRSEAVREEQLMR